MKKIFIAVLLVCSPAVALAAPISAEYFEATSSAATSTFSGNLSIAGQTEFTGLANGLLSLVDGFLRKVEGIMWDSSIGRLTLDNENGSTIFFPYYEVAGDYIKLGDATGEDMSANSLIIQGGAGTDTNGVGSFIYLNAGSGGDESTGANMQLQGGGGGTGGNTLIVGGSTSLEGDGGSVTLEGGSSTGGVGGSININSGSGTNPGVVNIGGGAIHIFANSTFDVSAGATRVLGVEFAATTTIDFGAVGEPGAHACFNTKNTVGDDISFYFVGTSMMVESNTCR